MDISKVVPGLWIASRFYPVDEDWPTGGVPVDCGLLLTDDDRPQGPTIHRLADAVWALRELGHPVVLVCDAGRNRSAVVAARSLIVKGAKPGAAIRLVREARAHLRGGALTNRAFVDYLMAQEVVAP